MAAVAGLQALREASPSICCINLNFYHLQHVVMMRWRCHTYRGVCVCVCLSVCLSFCMWMGSNPEPGVSESNQYPLDGTSICWPFASARQSRDQVVGAWKPKFRAGLQGGGDNVAGTGPQQKKPEPISSSHPSPTCISGCCRYGIARSDAQSSAYVLLPCTGLWSSTQNVPLGRPGFS